MKKFSILLCLGGVALTLGSCSILNKTSSNPVASNPDIYIVNNFVQIKDNPVWFATRKKTEDMIIDLSGNVIKVGEL